MRIGEVLGEVDCAVKSHCLKGMDLKIVRLYGKRGPEEVIVAGDVCKTAGNGDFVMLVSSSEIAKVFGTGIRPVDYAILGFINDCVMPYGMINNTELNVQRS